MTPSLAAMIKSDLVDTLSKRFPCLDSDELRESVGREVDKFQDSDSTPTAIGAPSPSLSGATNFSEGSV